MRGVWKQLRVPTVHARLGILLPLDTGNNSGHKQYPHCPVLGSEFYCPWTQEIIPWGNSAARFLLGLESSFSSQVKAWERIIHTALQNPYVSVVYKLNTHIYALHKLNTDWPTEMPSHNVYRCLLEICIYPKTIHVKYFTIILIVCKKKDNYRWHFCISSPEISKSKSRE